MRSHLRVALWCTIMLGALSLAWAAIYGVVDGLVILAVTAGLSALWWLWVVLMSRLGAVARKRWPVVIEPDEESLTLVEKPKRIPLGWEWIYMEGVVEKDVKPFGDGF